MTQLIYNANLLGQYTDTRLAKLTNRSVAFIWRERNRCGIAPYTHTYGYSPRNDYDITIFDVIDETSAYWLGFYCADGCVCKTGRRKLVCFSVSDYEVLVKLSDFYHMKSDVIKSVNTNGKPHYALQLCNAHLFDRLVTLGCVPRKSLILDKPKIDERFYLPFLMGFYDGDGCISRNSSINSWKASIGTGSKLLFDWIISIVNSFGFANSVELRELKSGNLFYMITMMGITAKVFLEKLYASVPSDLPLSRKKNLYEQLREVKLRGPNFFDWEIDYLRLSIDNIQCSNLISSDARNYGWVRTTDVIRGKRKNMANV